MKRGLAVAALAMGPSIALGACSSSSSPPAAAPVARTCSIIAPVAPDSRLHADGTSLEDSLGRVVFLRGVDAGGRSKFAPYMPFDYASDDAFAGALGAYMDRAATWGIDVMRVPFTWAAIESTQGTYDEAWMKRYDALLDAAWQHGIWTVVDFHQDVYSDVYCGDGFPGWTVPNAPMPHHDCPQWQLEYFGDKGVQAAFDAFWADASPIQVAYSKMWDAMLTRHKDRAGVIGFEPINEPGWGSAADTTMFEATTLSAFFANVAPHFRAAAPSSLVFIDPVGLAGVTMTTGLTRPPGDGVVFAPHFYPLGANSDAVLDKMTAWKTLGSSWNVPVWVGEFGASHALDTTPDYMSAHFDAFDALQIGGALWEYSVESEEWNSEQNSVVAADGTEYPVAASLIRPFPRAVAGDVTAMSFDTTSRTFALAYTPGASATTKVTEVSLPARAYPNGFDVALTGGCYDTSTPNRLLLQMDDDAMQVGLKITTH